MQGVEQLIPERGIMRDGETGVICPKVSFVRNQVTNGQTQNWQGFDGNVRKFVCANSPNRKTCQGIGRRRPLPTLKGASRRKRTLAGANCERNRILVFTFL